MLASQTCKAEAYLKRYAALIFRMLKRSMYRYLQAFKVHIRNKITLFHAFTVFCFTYTSSELLISCL